jgi:DNA polymerase (family 10)
VAIPNIGKSIALKLEELLRTGRIEELEALRRTTPADVLELTRIEGCGPKAVKALHVALGIRTIADLEAVCRAGRVREVPKFGEKTERKFLAGIGVLKRATGRIPLGDALPLARAIEQRLARLAFVDKVSAAGSVRRRKETVGDLDLLVVSREPRPGWRGVCRDAGGRSRLCARLDENTRAAGEWSRRRFARGTGEELRSGASLLHGKQGP